MSLLEITPVEFANYAPGFVLSKTAKVSFSCATSIVFPYTYPDDWFPPSISKGTFKFSVLCSLCLLEDTWHLSGDTFKTLEGERFTPGSDTWTQWTKAITSCINGWWNSLTKKQQKEAQREGIRNALEVIDIASAEARRLVEKADKDKRDLWEELRSI